VANASRGESRYGNGLEADVSVGGSLPLIAFGRGTRAPFVGLQMRVNGRFSLDDPKSGMISSDWIAGFHAAVDRGPWRLAAELFHESSHLGDEYGEQFGARRIDWTREVAGLWVRRKLGAITTHGNISYAVIDEPDLRPLAAAFGVDFRGAVAKVAGAQLGPIVGVFAEAQEYADWKVTTSVRAAVEVRGQDGPLLSAGLVYLNGLSTQRQFYDHRSRFFGFELRFAW
jgi:hypothetical protein